MQICKCNQSRLEPLRCDDKNANSKETSFEYKFYFFFIKTNVRIKTRIKYMTKYDNKDLL